jgi:hypothetical protein
MGSKVRISSVRSDIFVAPCVSAGDRIWCNAPSPDSVCDGMSLSPLRGERVVGYHLWLLRRQAYARINGGIAPRGNSCEKRKECSKTGREVRISSIRSDIFVAPCVSAGDRIWCNAPSPDSVCDGMSLSPLRGERVVGYHLGVLRRRACARINGGVAARGNSCEKRKECSKTGREVRVSSVRSDIFVAPSVSWG